jgi:hypothetical protein
MITRVNEFQQELIDFGVVDPEGLHHVFNQGLHGRKVDFDKIDEDRDPIFGAWVNVATEFIQDTYPEPPDALVGVANGTNRLAEAVAQKLGSRIIFLETEKIEQSKPVLTEEAKLLIEEFKPVFALVTEDVGTKGTNALSAAQSTIATGIPRVEVLNTWQRNDTLVLLDEAGITYRSIIKKVLDNFTPEECRDRGFCSQGWELIEYGK